MSPKDDVTKALKDALYVTVGLGVIAFQRAQVQRQELQKRFAGQAGGPQFQNLGKLVEDSVKTIEERLDGIEERIEAVVEQFEDRLPSQARDASRQARKAAKDARGQLRSLVNGNGR